MLFPQKNTQTLVLSACRDKYKMTAVPVLAAGPVPKPKAMENRDGQTPASCTICVLPCHCPPALGLGHLWGWASTPRWLYWAQLRWALSSTTSHSHVLEEREGMDGGSRGWGLQVWCWQPSHWREGSKMAEFPGCAHLFFPLLFNQGRCFQIGFTL